MQRVNIIAILLNGQQASKSNKVSKIVKIRVPSLEQKYLLAPSEFVTLVCFNSRLINRTNYNMNVLVEQAGGEREREKKCSKRLIRRID